MIVLASLLLDLEVSRSFFENGTFSKAPFYKFIYNYGTYPGWLLALSGLGMLFTRYKREGLFLVLVLSIGSGLIAHLFLKEGWPRPRPKQVIEFGGHAPFHPIHIPRYEEKGPFRSLPSGHATMGFYLLALIPIGRKWKKKNLIVFGILLSLVMGGLLSFARVAEGGHFFSDTLMSLYVMGGTVYFLSPLVCNDERTHSKTA